ncbi:hypothetical protein [Streptomyces turgidiscabies]|uniref:Transposase n=1 Tax=Streptomyces turgidiscabies TaxID=85558 RepID=A0ABU0S251_9ACTN|nr:hypothetical protein [Streptomyces turgidiscabies]MDQ0938068.1 hypothetical protein [Streptomyces turgidiscabies]
MRCLDRLPDDVFRQVLELLGELFSAVRALPPSAALVNFRSILSPPWHPP